MQHFTQLNVKILAQGTSILNGASVAFPKKPHWTLQEVGQILQQSVKMLTTNDGYNTRDNNDSILKNVRFKLLSVTVCFNCSVPLLQLIKFQIDVPGTRTATEMNIFK